MSKIDDDLSGVAWLEPWASIDVSVRDALTRDLSRELARGHVLFDRTARAIARRIDCDDVLFVIEGHRQLADVHLTYSTETSADWPRTRIFQTLSDFAEDCMEPDHAAFLDKAECNESST